MILAIADTHAAIWYLLEANRLSRAADHFFAATQAGGHQIGLSSITLVETVYLEEKGKVSLGTLGALEAALDLPRSILTEVTVDRRVATALRLINRSLIPDMPDRIIAATALALDVPVISRDGQIRNSGIRTVW